MTTDRTTDRLTRIWVPACAGTTGAYARTTGSYAGTTGSPVLDERAVAQLQGGLLQLGLGVHHDRPVPGDRLLDRLAGDEQEADTFLAGLHRHLVAAVEHDERAVAGALAHQGFALRRLLLGQHAERF